MKLILCSFLNSNYFIKNFLIFFVKTCFPCPLIHRCPHKDMLYSMALIKIRCFYNSVSFFVIICNNSNLFIRSFRYFKVTLIRNSIT